MNGADSPTFLTVKDHSVSGETFNLIFNSENDILSTEPQPSIDKLGSYYESEDYISHTDASRSIFEKVYHFIRNIALRQKISIIGEFKKSGKLLDLGTGTGTFAAYAQSIGWSVTGTEPNEGAQKIAIKRGVNVLNDSVSLPSNDTDVITMWHVLEHVPDLQRQISEIKRLLKRDGLVFIAVPNFRSFDAAIYKEHWAAYDVPRHLWHFSKEGISRLFHENQMKVIGVRPMKFDAFYVSLLSEKIKTGKMNYLRAVINGLRSNAKASKTGEYSSLIYIIKNAQ